ncbi:MAG TPA: 3-deoxy-7-phosphoheptulonate synthase [Chloroflexia bacterium]|nr:3-deoxy-7-phosphoheptulonate synthase [Chloroflexia bacterium]
MLVVMRVDAQPAEVDQVMARIKEFGNTPVLAPGTERICIGMLGDERGINPDEILLMSGVDRVVPILAPYKLASRDFQPQDTIVVVGDQRIGDPGVVLMAGPCSVESRAQTMELAEMLHGMGVRILRGGAFKPRTSPYAFQGMGENGLQILADVRERFGLAIVTEVMGTDEVELVGQYADMLQIGTRNMQNYRLLEAVGQQPKPVLLKRGMSSTLEELLLAAEYILSAGNRNVVLCERGIRTFERATRYTFDVNAIPMLKLLTHLPVIADPSHGTGRWDLVGPIARAAVAAGADGLIIEVHQHPEEALSDGAQSLRPERCAALIEELRRVSRAIGRDLAPPSAPTRRVA